MEHYKYKKLIITALCMGATGFLPGISNADSLRLVEPSPSETVVMPQSPVQGDTIIIQEPGNRGTIVPQGNAPAVIVPTVENVAPVVTTPVVETPVTPAERTDIVETPVHTRSPVQSLNPDTEKPTEAVHPAEGKTTTPVDNAKLELTKEKKATDIIAEKPIATTPTRVLVTPVITTQPLQQEELGSLSDIVSGMKENKKNKEKNTALVIPQNAKNLDFLQGAWRCDVGMSVNNPISGVHDDAVYEYRFDKNGKGMAYIKAKKLGFSFQGKATAKLRDGILEIQHGKLPMVENKQGVPAADYMPSTLYCKDKGKIALCRLVNHSPEGSKTIAEEFKFLRIK